MGAGFESTYTPDPTAVATYDRVYAKYKRIGHEIEGLTEEGIV
jgi:hypothetical protein